MKGVILLNGEPHHSNIDTSGSIVVCCDGAYKWAKQNNVRIDVVVGDFDSLGYTPEGAVVYPVEKDYTDAELALRLLIDKKVCSIVIYGGGGRRDDHYLANLALLIKAHELSIPCEFITNYTRSFLFDGGFKYKGSIGDTVSFLPISPKIKFGHCNGLKYDPSNLTIKLGESRGVSNLLCEEEINVEIIEGIGLFVILIRE